MNLSQIEEQAPLQTSDIFYWNREWIIGKFQESTKTIYLLGADTSSWNDDVPLLPEKGYTAEQAAELFEKHDTDPNALRFKVTRKGIEGFGNITPLTTSRQCTDTGENYPTLKSLGLVFNQENLSPPPAIIHRQNRGLTVVPI